MDDLVKCDAYLGGTKWLPRERLQWRPCVRGVVLHEGRLLVVTLSRFGKYFLPGGGVELGERLETALRREVREEIGIEIAVGPMLGFQESFFYFDPLDSAVHSLSFFFHGTPETFDLRTDARIDEGEAERPQWLDTSTLRPEDFYTDGELILAQVARLRREAGG